MRMKILYVHNRYQHAGGEDSVLYAEMKLMSGRGHVVSLALQENDAIKSFSSKVNVFLDVSYSKKNKRWMRDEIKKYQPDVIHVHNFFPLLSPSIYDACLELDVPVVQTLHNYRILCPGALLMRDGKVCELCIKGTAYQSILYRCYKSSFIGTYAVARMVEKHRASGTWNIKVNQFIALTEFARSKFIEAGFPEEKISVKPNFLNVTQTSANQKKSGALFIGRVSREKGISTLIKAWQSLDIPLRVAGTGPLEHELTNLKNNFVVSLGMLDRLSVQKEMSRAAFLVMPSVWYEGFPMVIVEAFSQGLPVIASHLGGMAEIIENGVTGLHFEVGNAKDLAEKVLWAHNHPEECRQMGLNARKVFEQKYTAEKNYEMLINIYHQVIEDT